jgi:hypothetical protein
MTAQPLILYEAAPNWRELADPLGTAPDAVRDIVTKMKKVDHKLPVGDVDDIRSQVARWRNEYPDFELSSVDLVAHATAGRVCVGYSTIKAEEASTNTGGVRHFVLDTNPKVYKVLIGINGVVTRDIPLRLLGCSTATVIDGYGLDGRILMIALANMLKCTVAGTNAAVDISDFKATGFTAASKLVRVRAEDCIPVMGSYDPATCCGQEHLVKTKPATHTPLGATGAQPVSSSEISTEGGGIVHGQSVNASWVNALLSQFASQGVRFARTDTLLAYPELIVHLATGTRLELLDTGRLLRWRRAKDTVLFEQMTVREEELARDLASALGSYAPWWCINSTRR